MTCIGKWEERSPEWWRYSVDGRVKAHIVYNFFHSVWEVKGRLGDLPWAEFIYLPQAKQYVKGIK